MLSCVQLCDPMDCSPPGSSVHGIFQVRILEWIAIFSSRWSSWHRDQTHVFCICLLNCRQILYHHCGSAGKESACNAWDLGSIPGLGRSPGEGKGYPLQYSGLENSMDCIVHGVAKKQTWLRDFHFIYTSLRAWTWLGNWTELNWTEGLPWWLRW